MRSSDEILQEWTCTLLPQGAAWPKDPSSNLVSLLRAIAIMRAELEADIAALAVEISPQTAMGLLSDYELVVGFDPCTGPIEALSISQRQSIAMAHWRARSVVSRADYIEFAQALGFSISISEYTPARFGQTCFGEPLYGWGWAFVWQVNVLAVSENAPLISVLECQIAERSPAHTIVLFNTEALAAEAAKPSPLGAFGLGLSGFAEEPA